VVEAVLLRSLWWEEPELENNLYRLTLASADIRMTDWNLWNAGVQAGLAAGIKTHLFFLETPASTCRPSKIFNERKQQFHDIASYVR
jgi:hypothetical protein